MSLTTVDQGLLATPAQYTMFKNRFINGAMYVDQRSAGASKSCSASTVTYTLDRWLVYPVGNAVAVQQVASGLSTGSPYALQVTGASSVTNVIVAQRIESKNIADLVGQTVTVSVTMSNSLLTSISWLAEYANTVDTFSATTSIASGTITVNSTMTTYSFSFVVPANGANGVSISLTAGAQTSGTWKITQAQLERGSTATSFDYRPYGTELALCQRYYVQYGPYGSASNNRVGSGIVLGSTYGNLSFCNVPMRATPTATSTAGAQIADAGANPAITSYDAINNLGSSINVEFVASGAGLTTGRACQIRLNSGSTDYVAFSSEL